MKTTLLTLLFAAALVAAKKDYTGYKVLQVKAENAPQLKALKNLQDKYDEVKEVDFWNYVMEIGAPVSIQVAPQTEAKMMEELQRHGMDSEVIIEDLQKLIVEGMKSNAERKTSNGEFQLDQYHDYDSEIVPFLTDLASKNEGTEYKSIGKTIEGRDIYMFSIATGDKPAISIECNIHAREWITGATCLNIITNLLTNEADKTLRDAYDWYFIPIANPDGFSYTWSDDRMWRKNRRQGSMCDGVDLNRNFDVNFGGSGSSHSQCSETYCGEAAFSEPETQASRDFVLSLKGRLKVHWSFHSYGLYYLLPWCYTYNGPEDFDNILKVAQASGEAIEKTHGTRFSIGECANILYEASGCTSDWVYAAAAPKFSATMELRDTGRYGFLLPPEQIMPVFEEVWNGMKAALDALQ